MCDYSLHAVPNRLAIEGEQLVTHRFPTSSIGLASPADLHHHTGPRIEAGKGWWQVVKSWLNPPPLRTERVPAVCIPPGARLRMSNVPKDLQQELNVGTEEEVTFVQLSASAYRYRDGIRFRNGREILLQYLDEGLYMDVLSLASAEPFEAVEEHHHHEFDEEARLRLR
jgi:hypothetical protein